MSKIVAGQPPEAVRVGEELMDLATSVSRVVRRRLRQEMPGPRLRGAQVQLLRAVADEPGIGVRAAARILHLADNSVSTLVNQLVSLGLLTREPDPADRRAARLRITPAAKRRLAEWRQRRGRLAGEIFADLPPDQVDAIAAALPALRDVLARLDAPDGPADVPDEGSDE
jgi:DNA-binding MarR family transcriptional regulator